VKRTAIVCLSATAMLTGILSGCTDSKSDGGNKPADPDDKEAASAQVIATFAAAWEKAWAPNGKPDEAAALTDAPTTFGPRLDGLDSALVAATVAVKPQGDVSCSDDNTCTQNLDVTAQLRGIGAMAWTSTATAVKVDINGTKTWKIKATGDVIYPGLGDTNTLKRSRMLPPRASILDRTGKPLTANRPVVLLGVEAGKKATPATYAAFTKYVQVDGAKLRQRALSTPAGQFVEAITLRQEDWTKVRARFDPLPGVVSIGDTQSLAATPSFARAILGGMKQATDETLKNAGPAASSTDQLGSSGLQFVFQRQLAGTPGATVTMRDRKTKLTVKKVFTQPAKPGTAVRTTLDVRLQNAAEAAVATIKLPTSLVAIQASTGQILATANGPGTTSYNRAFLGRYAPGSTFKIVTSTALLGQLHMTPNSPVTCSNTITVLGKTFKNYDALTAYGAGTLQKAFQQSCNTAMISNHGKLGRDGIRNAAALFGIGQEHQMSLASYGSSVPSPKDEVDKAASMIGQGTVTASPLQMALVAAAVKSGTPMKPVLVLGKDPSGPAAKPLPPAIVAALRQMMRATVTGGTAHILGQSGVVSAKTGTAEVVVKGKVTTNGWMVGFRNDIAFACIVEGGASGAKAAGPVLKSFLSRF
jgi:cell division protein FtsI/penicillin-binding protein 2